MPTFSLPNEPTAGRTKAQAGLRATAVRLRRGSPHGKAPATNARQVVQRTGRLFRWRRPCMTDWRGGAPTQLREQPTQRPLRDEAPLSPRLEASVEGSSQDLQFFQPCSKRSPTTLLIESTRTSPTPLPEVLVELSDGFPRLLEIVWMKGREAASDEHHLAAVEARADPLERALGAHVAWAHVEPHRAANANALERTSGRPIFMGRTSNSRVQSQLETGD